MKTLAALAALALVGCDQSKDWQGWVYPDRNNLTDSIPIGSFSTLGQCGASAKAVVIRFESKRDEQGNWIRGDYECGYKCKREGGLSGNVCEKTER